MSTRSLIGVNSNNIRSVYCHFDGYPEHHMPILQECYQTQEKANLLIDQGGISILDRRIGEEQDFQKVDEETCLFYHRDRKEELTIHDSKNWEEFLLLAQESGTEYVYLFENNEWTWAKVL